MSQDEKEKDLVPVDRDLISDEEETEGALLPYALAGHRVKLFLVAGVFVVASAGLALYLKSVTPLFLIVFALFFLWKGASVTRRYQDGKIREVAVLCTSVKPSRVRNAMTITFRTEGDDVDPSQEYFSFRNQPKRTADEFVVNSPYIIYFDIEEPQTLLAYISI